MKAITIVFASALITAAGIEAAPALAETPYQGDRAVSVVRTADLDLSTRTGQLTLDRRLTAAAHEVCGIASDADLAGKNDVRRCRDDVIAKARADRDTLLAAKSRGAAIAVTASR